jgi:hypothetical protein
MKARNIAEQEIDDIAGFWREQREAHRAERHETWKARIGIGIVVFCFFLALSNAGWWIQIGITALLVGAWWAVFERR